jgi:hypothetical protein
VFGLPKVIVIFLTVDVDPKSLTVAQVGKIEITAVIFRLKFLQLFHIDFLPGQQRHRWRYPFCEETATSLVVTAASAAAGSASLVQLVKARKLKAILSAKNFVFIIRGFRLLYLD